MARVQLHMNAQLLTRVDRHLQAHGYTNRSQFVSAVLIQYLSADGQVGAALAAHLAPAVQRHYRATHVEDLAPPPPRSSRKSNKPPRGASAPKRASAPPPVVVAPSPAPVQEQPAAPPPRRLELPFRRNEWDAG